MNESAYLCRIPARVRGVFCAAAKAVGLAFVAMGAVVLTAQPVSAQEPFEGWVTLIIDEGEIGTFAEADVHSAIEVTNPFTGLQLLRPRSSHTVTLRQGQYTSQAATWMRIAQEGDIPSAQQSGSVVMFSARAGAVARFDIQNCWPSSLDMGSLAAGDAAPTMDLTLTCEDIRAVTP